MHKNRILTALAILITFIFVLLACSFLWVLYTWKGLTMDQLVYHLTTNLKGTDVSFIIRFLWQSLLPSVVITAVASAVCLNVRRRGFRRARAIMLAASLLFLSMSVVYCWRRLHISGYLRFRNTDTGFIEDHYADPAEVSLTFPQQKRNLIYIFLESMETTYADKASGGGFDVNLIGNLTQIAQENEDFSGADETINGGDVMIYTTWTIAAMFAQTSGLPLKILLGANEMADQTEFFPGIITLGDILQEQGYAQTLLIGSEAEFAGRDLYFTQHGEYELDDYVYATESGMIPEDYKVWWGYEDEKLFEFAKEKLLELAASDQPFNLTMLTADTHFYDGYVCERCQDTYPDSYSNVISCSDAQTAEFIRWIQEQPFYENTTVVVVGDHLTMDEDYATKVYDVGDYDRRVYTAFINSAVDVQDPTWRRQYTTLDFFPTTLAAMGVEIEGNRLGLGVNLFSGEETLLEQYGYDALDEKLWEKSAFMDELSHVDMEAMMKTWEVWQ